jgi:hypothetical protein
MSLECRACDEYRLVLLKEDKSQQDGWNKTLLHWISKLLYHVLCELACPAWIVTTVAEMDYQPIVLCLTRKKLPAVVIETNLGSGVVSSRWVIRWWRITIAKQLFQWRYQDDIQWIIIRVHSIIGQAHTSIQN